MNHHPPARLSQELSALSRIAEDDGLTLTTIFDHLQGRVYPLLLVFIALPFCQPISLLGLSTPFGIVIALLGLRFALRKKPWLPKRLMSKKIPASLLTTILRGGAKMLRWIEKFLHPRATWVFDWAFIQLATGLMITCSGLLLLLPLPVPFSNFFPAMTVVLAASAISERDGGMLIASLVLFLIACLFIGLILFGGVELLSSIEAFLFPAQGTPGK